MDVQQITALALVAAAAGYLVRELARAVRRARDRREGCGSGCGKCAFAAPAEGRKAPRPGQVVVPLESLRSPHDPTRGA